MIIEMVKYHARSVSHSFDFRMKLVRTPNFRIRIIRSDRFSIMSKQT